MSDLWVLLPLGMVVGFIAGLFGIGGGALMVPALTAYFLWQGFDVTVVVHLALATSMSCIVINAMLSIWTHQQHQAILWHITARMSPFIIMGSLLATWYVIQLASQTIALIFMLLMVVVALHMVFDFSPKYRSQSTLRWQHWLPAGLFIGFFSALIAIGGGSLTVPFLTWHRINIKQAIATAASIGLPLAVAGSLVFAFSHNDSGVNLPIHRWGYIYWPATLVLSAGSLLTTHLGAKLTHRLPVAVLRRLFALLIVFLAAAMYLKIN